jgi:hypothetical protein
MATVARRLALRSVGETLLTSKLQILRGTGNRRPSIALSILTGRMAEQLSILENFYAADPVVAPVAIAPAIDTTEHASRPHYMARTVYLAEEHMRDIERIIEALSRQHAEPRRLNRSSVLRRAIEHLRTTVEADPAKFLLENE